MNSLDDPRLGVFLDALKHGETVDGARKEASLNWKLLYKLKKHSPDFSEAWAQAVRSGGRANSKVKTMTQDNVGSFLAALSGGATVSSAAEGSGINSASFYKRRHKDPEFARLWTEAGQKGREAASSRSRENEAAVFLGGIRAGKSSREAALVAGKDITTFYRLKRRDRVFADRWDEAVSEFRESHPRSLAAARGRMGRRPRRPLSGADWGGLSWAGGECAADPSAAGRGDGKPSHGGSGPAPGEGKGREEAK
ncbi:MAG: hypothetical protein LBW85_13420 [Deltaproteobacteria bacterium]|jgi:hypothetical protein|nr:hypothetical protein [Deltaproteobacteria bacterium]